MSEGAMELDFGKNQSDGKLQDFKFEELSLTKEYWDRVGKDLKVKNDNPV